MKRILCVALLLALPACLSCRGAGPVAERDDPIARIEDERHPESLELAEMLRDPSPDRRARAAIAMGRIQSAAYVEPLASATSDTDHAVRVAALFALGQLGLLQGGTPPGAAVEACEAALSDPDTVIVAASLEALGKLALAGVSEVVTPFLTHGSPEVRAAAAMALFRCRFTPLWRGEVSEAPALPASAVTALLDSMDDGDETARRMKVYAFSRYPQPGAAPRLARFVSDEDEWTRLFAVRGIGQSGDAGVAGAVEWALADPSDRVRTEAVGALAALGVADRLPVSLAADSSFHVRGALARALGEAGSRESLDVLRKLTNDTSATVKATAIEALGRRQGESYVDRLVTWLADGDWRLRASAAGAARHVGGRGEQIVEIAMGDADNRVRTAGLAALEGLGGDLAVIFDALETDDLAVRGTAVELLSDLGEAVDPEVLDRVAAAYRASPGVDWVEVREAIVDAVAPLQDAEVFLRNVAERDTAFSVRAKARAALSARAVELPAEDRPAAEASHLLGVLFDVVPTVVLETTKGEIRIRCLSDAAPIHVASFVELARKGYYDGLIWHRVVSNFVIQGGDPRGDGWGGAGYAMRDEINMVRYGRGAVGMPKAGKDTGGGQIFITHVPTPHLDGNYTVFGQVVEGLDVVDRIEVGDAIVRARVE